jgi:hypothetical protein
MRIGAALASAAACVLLASPARGGGPAPGPYEVRDGEFGAAAMIPSSVGRYANAVRATTPLPVDSIYYLGLTAARNLVDDTPLGPWGSILEGLSDADYAKVQADMVGFNLNREEVVFAEPDPLYFIRLSSQRGDSTSAAFFEACRQTSPWPSYIEQQTDYSGCVKFGSLELVRSYRLWARFRRSHPRRYEDRVEHFLTDVEETLTRGTCACGGKEETLREFRAFVGEFPSTPIAPQVRERIKALETGTSDIRYHCISG